MASAMTQQHRGRAILQLVAVLLLASPAAMLAAAAACDSAVFPAGKSYKTCSDLPTFGATLHWTYNASTSSLSLVFTAKPAATGGWVAWGINPTGNGMKGAQTLVAFMQTGAYVVNTYNLTGYGPLGAASTPIAYNATELAADDGLNGTVRLYGTLQLPKGTDVVNHIWQVGSAVVSDAPDKHAFGQENLDSKGALSLVTGAKAPEAAPAPEAGAPSPGNAGDSGARVTPSAEKTSVAAATAYAPVLAVLLALAGFLAIV